LPANAVDGVLARPIICHAQSFASVKVLKDHALMLQMRRQRVMMMMMMMTATVMTNNVADN
jgi:hypothetical protein